MLDTMSWRAAVRITCLFLLVVSVLTLGASAQSKPDDFTVTTSAGTFRLAALSSLINDTALLSAERVAELALPAAQKDVTAAKKDVDKIDADIATNFTAMEKEKETLAKARLEFQPAIDAYTRDLDVLHADDAQFGKDKAPV